ncbi:MAG: hypothetical protein IPP83_14145 [Flavobacteriales bacterium]|nr:hypothetical protein [Flavobacteriales bacterium]
MRRLRFPGVLLFYACAIGAVNGQSIPPDEVLHHDIKGLPLSTIRAMAKDREGFLWIGTENGLCRYDGINVDVYHNIPSDSTSLPGNHVQDLVIDGEGHMWVSCFGGIALFDPHLGEAMVKPRFERKDLFANGQRVSAYEAVDLALDTHGGVWATCVVNGLARYDKAADMFREVRQLRNAMPAEETTANVLGTTCDVDGMIWSVGWLSLYRFDPTTGRTKRYTYSSSGHTLLEGALLQRVTQDPNDRDILWIGAWGLGLVRFDKRTGSFENYMVSQGGPVNLTNIVWSLLPQRDGRILVGIDKGLHWFDKGSGSFSKTFGTFEWKSGVFDANAMVLVKDADDHILVGSVTGIFDLPIRSKDLQLWKPPAQSMCTANDHPGYWGAREYANRMLFKLGPSGEVLDSLPLPNADAARTEPISILQTRDHRVFIGTTRGLYIYAPATRSFKRELFHVAGLNGLVPSIFSMTECADGSVWMAFNGPSLLRYRPGGEGAELVELHTSAHDTASLRAWRSVNSMDQDHIAVTFEGTGVGVVDTRTMRLAELTGYGPQHKELVNVSALVVDPDGVLHAVTRNDGIVELRYEGDSIRFVTVHHDEPDDAGGYNDAARDASGNIWIATNDGLVLFNTTDHSFRHISAIDGLGLSSIASIIPDQDGYMLAWNSLCAHFNTTTFARTSEVNGVYIRSFTANGLLEQVPFALPHDRNSITISYAPIALRHADAVRYEVMLEGHDRTWVANAYERAVSYMSLAPGGYVFHVRVAGSNSAAQSARIAFTIVPAFWQTWWFKLLAVISIGAIIYAIARYVFLLRYRQRIAAYEREREVSEVRTRIARDIHDDLGSGLTRITMLSRELNKEGAEAKERDKLADHIASASTELIGQLSEIVWTVDPKNDHAEHFIAYVRDLLGRQFEELTIDLRTELTIEPGMERRDIPPDVKRNTVMILKETVSNALKHADARTITVKLHIGVLELLMDVEDDGHGFDQANGSRGYGQGNLRKRSDAMGGTLHVMSDATGTRLTLRVPLPAPTIMRVD